MKIPYGISDYKSIKEEGYCYVDKTMYLEKLENVGKTLLYLKPRRFGKSLFTSMMYYYYDINSVDRFDTLFKDTYVYKNQTPNKNNYYVLRFDFSGMSVESDDLNSIKKAFLEKVCEGIEDFLNHYKLSFEIDYNLYPAELLGRFFVYYNSLNLDKKIYIVIDEYDNFTNSILSNNREMFRKILGSEGFVKAFYARIKEYCGKAVVDRVFITGVCSISIDSMTSGFNIAKNITVSPLFNSMTALTHNEVKNLLDNIDLGGEHFDIMIQNYDGYKFARENEELVFNPTLTMYYLESLINEGCPPLDLLDSNIISNFTQLKNIISIGNPLEILDDIFNNGEVISTLTVNYSDTTMFGKDDIISLLFYFGYLTIKEARDSIHYVFVIPNKVIRTVYSQCYLSLLNNIVLINDVESDAVFEIRESGKIDKFVSYISRILKNVDNRVYIDFREKDLQLLMYTILSRYTEVNVELEYKTEDRFMDIYTSVLNYHLIIELKYLKKKDKSEYKKVHNQGLEQLNEYTIENISKDKIKKYLVIFIGSDYTIDEVK